MAKQTIAELSRFIDVLKTGLDAADREVTELSETIEELRDQLAVDRLAHERVIAELRQENALLRQRLDDHLKRVEKWDTRFWGLLMVLVGALLSLASGLIVVLVKK